MNPCCRPVYSSAALEPASVSRRQGSRMRNTKTEFISCPSCGRTLFDLQSVTQRIRAKTDHLKGVTIAIMDDGEQRRHGHVIIDGTQFRARLRFHTPEPNPRPKRGRDSILIFF